MMEKFKLDKLNRTEWLLVVLVVLNVVGIVVELA